MTFSSLKHTFLPLCLQAVDQLNLRTKNFRDLLTDKPFVKADIITLQVLCVCVCACAHAPICVCALLYVLLCLIQYNILHMCVAPL